MTASRLLARLLVAATGASAAACGTTGLDDTSQAGVWVGARGGAAGTTQGAGGSSNAGAGGSSNAGGSQGVGGLAAGGSGGFAQGGSDAAGGAAPNAFCKTVGCVPDAWCGDYTYDGLEVCHCQANGQATCQQSPAPGGTLLLCYENPDGQDCLPIDSSSLSSKLGTVYASSCGSYASSGPVHATTSAGVPACCYTALPQGCTGRPIDIEGTARVAALTRRAGWGA